MCDGSGTTQSVKVVPLAAPSAGLIDHVDNLTAGEPWSDLTSSRKDVGVILEWASSRPKSCAKRLHLLGQLQPGRFHRAVESIKGGHGDRVAAALDDWYLSEYPSLADNAYSMRQPNEATSDSPQRCSQRRTWQNYGPQNRHLIASSARSLVMLGVPTAFVHSRSRQRVRCRELPRRRSERHAADHHHSSSSIMNLTSSI